MNSKERAFISFIITIHQLYLREPFAKIIYVQLFNPDRLHCQVICQLFETSNLQSHNRYFTKFCIHLSQLCSMIWPWLKFRQFLSVAILFDIPFIFTTSIKSGIKEEHSSIYLLYILPAVCRPLLQQYSTRGWLCLILPSFWVFQEQDKELRNIPLFHLQEHTTDKRSQKL